MIGRLTSLVNSPERSVKLLITSTEIRCEISEPAGSFDPQNISHYELSGLLHDEHGLVTLTFVFFDKRRVRFYCTNSKADMALLLDQLDGTIGERRREVARL